MSFPINGDIVPVVSGASHLGVDESTGAGSFDIGSISPFGNIHMLSGIFHDPIMGQSGVIRFSLPGGGLEQSVDGGASFTLIGACGGVTSIGVLGDTNLTGAVDLATPSSGFMVVEDSSDASPLLFSVDHLGLSGLWNFPGNGFPSESAQCYAETFAASLQWTISHNIGTEDVMVTVYDDDSPRSHLVPDRIVITDSDTVTITFVSPQGGRVVIIGCV